MEAIRSVMLAYFNACDVPRFDFDHDYVRLFTADAIWEGVGERYAAKFGRLDGGAAIVAALEAVLDKTPAFQFNHHMLSNERIDIALPDHATGTWSMTQMTTSLSGEASLALARIAVKFQNVGGAWRIAHFTTRNLCFKVIEGGWNHATERPNL